MHLVFLLLTSGCISDQGFNTSGDVEEYAPAIRLEPHSLDFGQLEPGDSLAQTFQIFNDGDAALFVSGMEIDGSEAYTLSGGSVELTLPPGGTETIEVVYSPVNLEDQGLVAIDSSDPDTPTAWLELMGEGLIPLLSINPSPYDFGFVPLDCVEDAVIHLENIGSADLTIEELDPPRGAFDLVWVDDLPITITPGQDTDVRMSFFANGAESADSDFYVYSDDPNGVSLGQLFGSTDMGQRTESFWQLSGTKTDLFFYVDRSRSMTDDIENLSSNFDKLLDSLGDYALDYQIMVVTNDDGCHNEQILTGDTEGASDIFKRAAKGIHGQWTEAGLTIAHAALQQVGVGGCNDGFLRDGSKPVVVLISDEPEQSLRSWEYYTYQMMGDAPSLSILSIVGPQPRGCTTAEAGDGYIEASTYTNTPTLSICSPDWGDYFQDIALIGAQGLTDTFVLGGTPVSDLMTVEVDGEVIEEGWSYEAGSNAIVFDADAVPDEDSLIEVTYETTPEECEG